MDFLVKLKHSKVGLFYRLNGEHDTVGDFFEEGQLKSLLKFSSINSDWRVCVYANILHETLSISEFYPEMEDDIKELKDSIPNISVASWPALKRSSLYGTYSIPSEASNPFEGMNKISW